MSDILGVRKNLIKKVSLWRFHVGGLAWLSFAAGPASYLSGVFAH